MCILCQWSLLRYAQSLECSVHPDIDRFHCKLATGAIPFPSEGDVAVISKVLRGRRPQKPQFTAPGITPAVWNIAKKCWRAKAKERPELKEVLQELENIGKHGTRTLDYDPFAMDPG